MPDAAPRPGRIVVLASGTGSIFEALLEAVRRTGEARVTGLVCDQPGAGVLDKAAAAGVTTHVVPLLDRARRAEWDGEVAAAIETGTPDLVVSAGFMKLLGPAVLERFTHRILNTHPALLPAFPGAHAVRDALAYGVAVSGCTVHLVDAGVDTGPVLAQRAVPVLPDDDEATLHERIKQVERDLLPDVALRMLRQGWTVQGRRVTIP